MRRDDDLIGVLFDVPAPAFSATRIADAATSTSIGALACSIMSRTGVIDAGIA